MKAQHCCVVVSASGGLLSGLGLIVTARRLFAADLVLRSMEPHFAPMVLMLGVVGCASACLGWAGACFTNRLALCVHCVCTSFFSIGGFLLSADLLAKASSCAKELGDSCVEYAGAPAVWSAQTRSLQRSYNSMAQALENCRRNGRPAALGLFGCGQLARDNDGRWFMEDPWRELFFHLEQQGGCGGFCTGDLPLFALPQPGSSTPVDQSSKRHVRAPCFQFLAETLQASASRAALLTVLLSSPVLLALCGVVYSICLPPPRRRPDHYQQTAQCEGAAYIEEEESERLLDSQASSHSGSSEELMLS